jgi:hypothetical protein
MALDVDGVFLLEMLILRDFIGSKGKFCLYFLNRRQFGTTSSLLNCGWRIISTSSSYAWVASKRLVLLCYYL